MRSGISYFVSYACSNCRTQLEARPTGWDGWLRCPACNWPSLPPEIMVHHRKTDRPAIRRNQDGDDDIVIISASEADIPRPDSRPIDGDGRSSHTTPARLIISTGFALSLFFVLVAYLDDKMGRMAIFAMLAIGCFFLLVRTPRNRLE